VDGYDSRIQRRRVFPPGVHTATLGEIAARFGQESELRRAQMESLGWLVDLARRAGARRLIVNGSFVTDKFEPNDVDCALMVETGFPRDAAAGKELVDGLPFIELKIVDEDDFKELVEYTFASDRETIPKGVIEVLL
jgi:hypothetical protein